MTRVADVMTRGVRSMGPQDSLQAAAQAMDELNIGAIPVCEGDRLVGMVTDRDIIVRGVARGLPIGQTALREVMSAPVRVCREDDPLDQVTAMMGSVQLRRVPVLDDGGQLVGILSLGDVAAKGSAGQASEALTDISEPSEPDRSGEVVSP